MTKKKIISFPHLGDYHIPIHFLLTKLTKYKVITAPPIVCVPFKYNLGNFIESLENGANVLIQAGGGCRYGYYGELQEPATMFAKTLRGIGKEHDDVIALNILSERALSPNFFNTVLNEYSRDGQMAAFIKEVQYMGLLKRASYANFGYEDVSYLRNSKTYLERLKNITTQMRDYREPFNDGYEGI